jgi:hypothetical protein
LAYLNQEGRISYEGDNRKAIFLYYHPIVTTYYHPYHAKFQHIKSEK